MVLEPLSAFAVACNVLQIVDSGWRILVRTAEYRRAQDGALAEQRELRDVSRTLQNLSKNLEASINGQTPSATDTLSENEKQLLTANQQCLSVSAKFNTLLDRLKVKDRGSTFDSLAAAIRAHWYRDELEGIRKSLSEARENLNIAFLLYMNSHHAVTLAQTSDKLTTATMKSEQAMLDAVSSSSTSIRAEISQLGEQLKDLFLDSQTTSAADFETTDYDVLSSILNQMNQILETQQARDKAVAAKDDFTSHQRLLESLRFPQMFDRREQVHETYASTGQWMLNPAANVWTTWSSFSEWVLVESPQARLYWIYGKPGSGKSTIVKFLDDHLSAHAHMHQWLGDVPLIKAVVYIWKPGTLLQRSLLGIYRSLLLQLLAHVPQLISSVVPPEHWTIAQAVGPFTIVWTEHTLRSSILSLVESLQGQAKLLLFIDGLDELDGPDDDEVDKLIAMVKTLQDFAHVKICVASRYENVFLDAFGEFPQLCLQDLTAGDIATYIGSRLHECPRWPLLRARDPVQADDLVRRVIRKAAGVFLWVRLVVRNLVGGIRDGDDLPQLLKTLKEIPEDLDEYFRRIIDSIKPRHRREASTLLQLALHQETQFVTLSPLRLIDVTFVGEEHEDFATRPDFDFSQFDVTSVDAVLNRIDSNLRRLRSRCMGLLEWIQRDQELFPMWPAAVESLLTQAPITTRDIHQTPKREDTTWPDTWQGLFTTRVAFLHRSLRDFLETPKMQAWMHEQTHGKLDARLFLCSSRVVEFTTLHSIGPSDEYVVGTTSFILSALSVMRDRPVAAALAKVMQKAMKNFEIDHRFQFNGWYAIPILSAWQVEQSSFFTLALDFNVRSFVLDQLTPQIIREKKGRPILDYILRPRFPTFDGVNIANQRPEMDILNQALDCGADPNQISPLDGVSVWALFLCSFMDLLLFMSTSDLHFSVRWTAAYLGALRRLTQVGADPILPRCWLAARAAYEAYDYHPFWDGGAHGDDPFSRRWKVHVAIAQASGVTGDEPLYSVSSILENFRGCFGPELEPIMQDLRAQEKTWIADKVAEGKDIQAYSEAETSVSS